MDSVLQVDSMKYIFLDIDGVLNCYSDFFKKDGEKKERAPRVCGYAGIADNKLRNLALIYNSVPECKIVLCSSWKEFLEAPEKVYDHDLRHFAPKIAKYVHKKFSKFGLKLEGTTYDYEPRWYLRAQGILNYMKEYGIDKKDIIILEDEDFNYEQYELADRFVQTNYEENGLTEELAKKAIDILSK